ncbi:hypothetical protein OB919_01385 [Halobacteria archaeon AArc-curdl1]|uniref:Uncharacterized protein n=1 Tax=Natronosalvus hydrolyticus TaxID=2979988 RepID=A0AAP2Z4K9_9EURY|nr:hypothetical protein [Halobacteria archaeon AArc-curdl1]
MAAHRSPVEAVAVLERPKPSWKFSDRRPKRLTMGDTERKIDARIAVSTETRDQVRDQKRGGETYDQLLQKVADQFDPNEAPLQD